MNPSRKTEENGSLPGPLSEREGELYFEELPLLAIADRFGTPCYVYSKRRIEEHFRAFEEAFGDHPHLICYAVKANSNLAVLQLLARLGAGFDIVSVGELERVLRAGGDPSRVVFSGVGKREDELKRALEVGIGCFNIEVEEELFQLNQLAKQLQVRAPISIRVNPDVDAKTHPYIATGLKKNKFGLEVEIAFRLYLKAAAMSHIEIVGLDCHIGSQLTALDAFLAALDRLLHLASRLEREGIEIHHLDLGGGLGVCYREEMPPSPKAYVQALLERLDKPYKLLVEPGRAIVADAGVLLTRVVFLKETSAKNFAIVDAGMNDLLRPALYNAYHPVWPVVRRAGMPKVYDIVGPVCETGDFLAQERKLALEVGDLLAIGMAGAYGFVMSSNYNGRPRPPEIMVSGSEAYLIRKRELLEDLWQGERLLS